MVYEYKVSGLTFIEGHQVLFVFEEERFTSFQASEKSLTMHGADKNH